MANKVVAIFICGVFDNDKTTDTITALPIFKGNSHQVIIVNLYSPY